MQVRGSAGEALSRLIDGNSRFSRDQADRPNQTIERRQEVTTGQKPFAVIVSCSDSRIPPEIVFDQGIGDLFVVRVAGNIVDDLALGSIEYAVEHLGAKLVMVLGHGKCGAVTAAVQGGHAPGHIGGIVSAIHPAVDKARTKQGDLTDNSIRENVGLVVEAIRLSEPILADMAKKGDVKVVGAYYDLESGAVEVL